MPLTVRHWLDSLQLVDYTKILEAAGYVELSKCASLTDETLIRLGIADSSHRRRMLSHLPSSPPPAHKPHVYINVPDPRLIATESSASVQAQHTSLPASQMAEDFNNTKTNDWPPPAPCNKNPNAATYVNAPAPCKPAGESSTGTYLNMDGRVDDGNEDLAAEEESIYGNVDFSASMTAARPTPKPRSSNSKAPIPQPRLSLQKKKMEHTQVSEFQQQPPQPIIRNVFDSSSGDVPASMLDTNSNIKGSEVKVKSSSPGYVQKSKETSDSGGAQRSNSFSFQAANKPMAISKALSGTSLSTAGPKSPKADAQLLDMFDPIQVETKTNSPSVAANLLTDSSTDKSSEMNTGNSSLYDNVVLHSLPDKSERNSYDNVVLQSASSLPNMLLYGFQRVEIDDNLKNEQLSQQRDDDVLPSTHLAPNQDNSDDNDEGDYGQVWMMGAGAPIGGPGVQLNRIRQKRSSEDDGDDEDDDTVYQVPPPSAPPPPLPPGYASALDTGAAYPTVPPRRQLSFTTPPAEVLTHGASASPTLLSPTVLNPSEGVYDVPVKIASGPVLQPPPKQGRPLFDISSSVDSIDGMSHSSMSKPSPAHPPGRSESIKTTEPRAFMNSAIRVLPVAAATNKAGIVGSDEDEASKSVCSAAESAQPQIAAGGESAYSYPKPAKPSVAPKVSPKPKLPVYASVDTALEKTEPAAKVPNPKLVKQVSADGGSAEAAATCNNTDLRRSSSAKPTVPLKLKPIDEKPVEVKQPETSGAATGASNPTRVKFPGAFQVLPVERPAVGGGFSRIPESKPVASNSEVGRSDSFESRGGNVERRDSALSGQGALSPAGLGSTGVYAAASAVSTEFFVDDTYDEIHLSSSGGKIVGTSLAVPSSDFHQQSQRGSTRSSLPAKPKRNVLNVPGLESKDIESDPNVYSPYEFVPGNVSNKSSPDIGVQSREEHGRAISGDQHEGSFLEDSMEDDLSDGGELLDTETEQRMRDASRIRRISIPLLKVKEKRGFLHKLSSISKGSHFVWRKIWMTFDEKDIKYYDNDKSAYSRRIIPINSARSIDRDSMAKPGDSHPFRMKLMTVDRIFTFAVDSEEECMVWLGILASALQNIKSDSYPPGGEMKDPEKQGLVRIDKMKGQKLLAVKKGKLCFYHNPKDFVAGSPIHKIDMKLANVKDNGKLKLLLTTPNVAFTFVFETTEEATEWRVAMEAAIAEALGDDTVLTQVYENHSNRCCADCGLPDPHWSSVNFCITICDVCAGIHRHLTDPRSKVRSLRMDHNVWTPFVVQLVTTIGNDNANQFWEYNIRASDKVGPNTDQMKKKEFIMNKYVRKRFCRLHPLHDDLPSLNEALCKAARFSDVQETMQLLFSGADITYCSQIGVEHGTALQIAKKCLQPLQTEFLIQNGAEQLLNAPALPTAPRSPSIFALQLQGNLMKTGPNPKSDFQRRWCVLKDGIFCYYENERAPNQRSETVENTEMLGIFYVFDERQAFSFELSTTKQSGRSYLLAAENESSRQEWVTAFAKVILSSQSSSAPDKLADLDAGGKIFIRDGTSCDWERGWMHMKGRKLFILRKNTDTFEEIDVRKLRSFRSEQPPPREVPSQENSFRFIIHSTERVFYIQGDIKKETESWYKRIEKAYMLCGTAIEDQPLTKDDVPIIVDKFIDYLEVNGLRTEGIYRKSGQKSKVTALLNYMVEDVRGARLKVEEHLVEEVASALKLYLRSLQDCVLTSQLYDQWAACSMNATNKLLSYKQCLRLLPVVNFQTLKKLIGHLVLVSKEADHNKMTILNLASIFGPVLMGQKQDTDPNLANSHTQEISVVRDFCEHYLELFEVKMADLSKAQQITRAMNQITDLMSVKPPQVMKIDSILYGIHVGGRSEHEVICQIGITMTALEVLAFVAEKSGKDMTNWSLYELLCDGDLERRIHDSEHVYEMIMQYSTFPDEFRSNCSLCVKSSIIDQQLAKWFNPSEMLSGTLKMCDKDKKFKNAHIGFVQQNIVCYKDAKFATPLMSWKIEDVIVYVGVPLKRDPPLKWGFTFYSKEDRSNWRSVCCASQDELHRWLATLLHASAAGGGTSSSSSSSGGAGAAGGGHSSHSPLQTQTSEVKSNKPLFKNVANMFRGK